MCCRPQSTRNRLRRCWIPPRCSVPCLAAVARPSRGVGTSSGRPRLACGQVPWRPARRRDRGAARPTVRPDTIARAGQPRPDPQRSRGRCCLVCPRRGVSRAPRPCALSMTAQDHRQVDLVEHSDCPGRRTRTAVVIRCRCNLPLPATHAATEVGGQGHGPEGRRVDPTFVR